MSDKPLEKEERRLNHLKRKPGVHEIPFGRGKKEGANEEPKRTEPQGNTKEDFR